MHKESRRSFAKKLAGIIPAICLAGILTACHESKTVEEPRPSSASSATPSSTVQADHTQVATRTPPAVDTTKPVIATAEGDVSGFRIEINEIKRTPGDTLTLKFTAINDSPGELNFFDIFKDSDLTKFSLIDSEGKKKYEVITDGQGTCYCSRQLQDIASHTRRNLWAKFPAPPEGVEKVSLILPSFPPIEELPISR